MSDLACNSYSTGFYLKLNSQLKTSLTQNLSFDFDNSTDLNIIKENTFACYDKNNVSNEASNEIHKKRITEVYVSAQAERSNDIVLAMLAHLSQKTDERWFTWVTRNNVSVKAFEQLRHYNFNKNKIRVIHAKNNENLRSITRDALRNGTSATVVSDINYLSEENFSSLENAAKQGKSEGVILKRIH